MSGELLELEDHQRHLLIEATATIVAVSYLEDKSRRTMAENRRRTQLCIDLIRVMRSDCRWSVQRCIDELPRALRCKLDGAPWEPDKRQTWWGT